MLLQAVRLSVCHTGGSVTRSQAVARTADRTATAPLGVRWRHRSCDHSFESPYCDGECIL